MFIFIIVLVISCLLVSFLSKSLEPNPTKIDDLEVIEQFKRPKVHEVVHPSYYRFATPEELAADRAREYKPEDGYLDSDISEDDNFALIGIFGTTDSPYEQEFQLLEDE